MVSKIYNIAAIIVTYNPDMRQVQETVDSIIQQVSRCIIIDNGDTEFEFQGKKNIIVVNLGKNYGIGYAQNRGMELAKQNNAEFVVLSDQDTVYPDDFIQKNIIAYQTLKNYKLAALVPVIYNSNKKEKIPVMVKKFSSAAGFSKPYIQTAQAISSGSFIVMSSLKDIGGMNEKLFIDYVDFEWCWRATGLGYEIFTISDLIINHQLGDEAKSVFGRPITIRKDIRYYYMIRNGCYLARYSPYLNWHERILFFKRILIHIAGIVFLKRSLKSIQFIGAAVLEGLTGNFTAIG